MSEQKPLSYFQDLQDAPFHLKVGSTLLVFTGPHNGLEVPEALPPYLGTDKDWFLNAHESHDVNMAAFWQTLQQLFPDASFLTGRYSRLVTDLNKIAGFSVDTRSCENQEIKIPANCRDVCPETEISRRIEHYYGPYHAAKNALIEHIRAQHDGKIIVLDMHSFSPTWLNKKTNKIEERDVAISTIRHQKTDLSMALEPILRSPKNHAKYRFRSGFPYRVAERPKNAALQIMMKNKLQYLGIEMRNDLIGDEAGRMDMALYLKSAIDEVISGPKLDMIAAPCTKFKPHKSSSDKNTISERDAFAPEYQM